MMLATRCASRGGRGTKTIRPWQAGQALSVRWTVSLSVLLVQQPGGTRVGLQCCECFRCLSSICFMCMFCCSSLCMDARRMGCFRCFVASRAHVVLSLSHT